MCAAYYKYTVYVTFGNWHKSFLVVRSDWITVIELISNLRRRERQRNVLWSKSLPFNLPGTLICAFTPWDWLIKALLALSLGLLLLWVRQLKMRNKRSLCRLEKSHTTKSFQLIRTPTEVVFCSVQINTAYTSTLYEKIFTVHQWGARNVIWQCKCCHRAESKAESWAQMTDNATSLISSYIILNGLNRRFTDTFNVPYCIPASSYFGRFVMKSTTEEFICR